MSEMLGKKLKKLTSGEKDPEEILLLFWCPGCKKSHPYRIKGYGPTWSFDGNLEKPTFLPSLLVMKSDPEAVCHLYLKEGQIQFLSDSHHELAGKTVECPDWPLDKFM